MSSSHLPPSPADPSATEPQITLRERWNALPLPSAGTTESADSAPTIPSPAGPNASTPVLAPAHGAGPLLPSPDLPQDYVALRVIGEGGMGVVHLGRQASLHREVAIKSVRPEGYGPHLAALLLREAWITGLLEHPNIIPVHHVSHGPQGRPAMVMKLVEGVSWDEALRVPERLPSALRGSRELLDAHLDILRQVCNAVHFAHSKGIVHRDLKPENVMLGAFGEVYVVDWGLAVSLRDDGSGRLPLAREVTTVAGTPCYLAPEMAAARGDLLGPWSDVYLLGATLHEIVTGTVLHDGPDITAILGAAYASSPPRYDAAVPADLAAIIHRATARSPSKRYPSAEALRLGLEDYAAHRESLRLAREAEQRREGLDQEIAGFLAARPVGANPGTPLQAEQDHLRNVQGTFGEARFGYDHALRIWAENTQAQQGREQLLRSMAQLEISLGDARAAQALLQAMHTPDPALLACLDALRADQEQARREVAKLRKLGEDVDVEVARLDRSTMTFVLGILLGILPLANSALIKQGIMAFHYPGYFAQFAAVFTIIGLTVLAMRQKLLQNQANRRIIGSIFGMLGASFTMRVLGFLLGLPVAGALALENAAFGCGILMMSILVDARLVVGVLPFIGAAIGMSFRPDWALELDAASNALALWLIALAWRYHPAED